MKETTIVVKPGIMQRLDDASSALRLSRSRVIVMLMKRLMDDAGNFLRSDRLVEYQRGGSGELRKRLHVCVDMRQYESFLDLRKLCKKSVSLLVALAVDKYLTDIVNEVLSDEKGADNYRIEYYRIEKIMVDSLICWKIYWGKPKKE